MNEVTGVLRTPEEARSFGVALGRLLRAGDLVLLTGDLGAGKTTVTQGVGEGLKVRGPVTSPTFVIARVHPPLGEGPALVHADAYRLGGRAELDDLDLDTDLAEAVAVVEWGSGIAESLGQDRLEVSLQAREGRGDRDLRLRAVGQRWSDPAAQRRLHALVTGSEASP
jgi:tRNA threonylcarbamoyladenosine biosynthesis protein TsaE